MNAKNRLIGQNTSIMTKTFLDIHETDGRIAHYSRLLVDIKPRSSASTLESILFSYTQERNKFWSDISVDIMLEVCGSQFMIWTLLDKSRDMLFSSGRLGVAWSRHAKSWTVCTLNNEK